MYGMPLSDPRYQNATIEQIALDVYAEAMANGLTADEILLHEHVVTEEFDDVDEYIEELQALVDASVEKQPYDWLDED